MNRNETISETNEETASPVPMQVGLKWIRDTALARSQNPQKDEAREQVWGEPEFGWLATELTGAIGHMSKADAKELVGLMDAGIDTQCGYHEMVAAMLDAFGVKHNTHVSTVLFLSALVDRALHHMGLPDGQNRLELAVHAAKGRNRTKPTLAEFLAKDEILAFLRSDTVKALRKDPETAKILNPSTLVLEREGRGDVAPRFTAVAESAMARAAGLVVKAKLSHRPAEYAMPQIRRLIDGAGLSGLDAEFCIWLGSLTGERLAGGIRSRIERMAAVSPWFVGTLRARTAKEMMRAAASGAA